MKPFCLYPGILIALACTLAAQTPGPAPRFDSFQIIGPGGGGTTMDPVISPHDPSIVVEHSDMTGNYITLDGGSSWRMFNLRAGINAFAFDPSHQTRIYAGSAALWRSDDSGRTWRTIFPNPAGKTVEHQNGDHGDYSLTSDDRSYITGINIEQIAVDPKDSSIVHIACSEPHGGTRLMVSKDAGATFHKEAEYPSDKIILLSYPTGRRLAIGSKGAYLGMSNVPESIGEPGEKIINASAGDANRDTFVYATTSKGRLYVSEDGGKTWQPRTPALGKKAGEFGAIATSAHQGLTAYVGFRGLSLGDGLESFSNGIAKTMDAGKTWSIVFSESTHAALNLDASWIEQRAKGTDWAGDKSIIFDAPYSLAVAPGNPGVCYATDLFRTYRTLDGGASWAQVNSVRLPGDRWTTRGLDVTTAYGVQFDPFDRNHVFIDYTDIGAFQSVDGGKSWESATNGIPDPWRNSTYWLAFDPQVKNLMWGAFSGIHDLPRPKMWRHGDFLVRARGGVAISTDGGRNWLPSNSGMRETAVTHVLLDPASPPGSRTLYACGFGVGVYKSIDNGKTWQLKNRGITETDPFAWRIVRNSDGALYLIISRRNEASIDDSGGDGALYKSIDGAENWTKIKLPSGVNGPSGLALDPRENRRIYLAAWGKQREGVDKGGGVYLSTDAGVTWRPIFVQSQHVYDVTIDPNTPDTLYICGFDAAAYRSTDAGLHWARITGFNFKWGHRVTVDPGDASKIYIATYGGSVWHGPAGGDPGAVEDVLTPLPIAQQHLRGPGVD